MSTITHSRRLWTTGERRRQIPDDGKREMQMTETILKNNLPEEFTGVYETPGVENIQVNRFEETTEGHTRYICETEFKFERLSMKIISKLFPGAFKKQTLKFMNSFKNFVEGR